MLEDLLNHLNFFIINPFPIPRPEKNDTKYKRVIELSERFDVQMIDMLIGQKINVDYGPLPDNEKQDKIEELDAVVAHLYGQMKSTYSRL